MEFVFLTPDFFTDHQNLQEIEIKDTRPYILITITINNIKFALPLRSGISHNHQFPTDKANNCGVDYSKAVIIDDMKYIDTKTPYIRPNEYKTLIGKEYLLRKGMEKYINDYIKAKNKSHIKANQDLCRYSTLQNYHIEIGLQN